MIRRQTEQPANVRCWIGSGGLGLRPALLGSLS